jgi:hypothetical protein
MGQIARLIGVKRFAINVFDWDGEASPKSSRHRPDKQRKMLILRILVISDAEKSRLQLGAGRTGRSRANQSR